MIRLSTKQSHLFFGWPLSHRTTRPSHSPQAQLTLHSCVWSHAQDGSQLAGPNGGIGATHKLQVVLLQTAGNGLDQKLGRGAPCVAGQGCPCALQPNTDVGDSAACKGLPQVQCMICVAG